MAKALNFLAFDTSTDRLSVALGDGTRVWQFSGTGGAQASTTLVPAVLDLLAQAGMEIGDLAAIVFGRGPGSFTGLRTACAVAQGLALGARHGAGIPVLPVDTLMAVAEEARAGLAGPVAPLQVTALLDARMEEIYIQRYAFGGDAAAPAWRALGRAALVRPEQLLAALADRPGDLLAGNPFAVYAGRFGDGLSAFAQAEVFPTAGALLRLAPALMAAGEAVDAALALPLYVRDKVAYTSEERAEAKARGVAPGTPLTTSA